MEKDYTLKYRITQDSGVCLEGYVSVISESIRMSADFSASTINEEIEIAPSWRGIILRSKKGLAREVCEEALKFAQGELLKRGHKLRKATMQTAGWNTTYQKLAISLGYHPVENFYVPDTLCFEKLLR